MAHAVAAQRPAPPPAPELEHEEVEVKVRKGRMYYDGLRRHRAGEVVTVVASFPKGKKLVGRLPKGKKPGNEDVVIGQHVLLWAEPLDDDEAEAANKPIFDKLPEKASAKTGEKAGDAGSRRGVL